MRSVLCIPLFIFVIVGIHSNELKIWKDVKRLQKGQIMESTFVETKRLVCSSNQFTCPERCIPASYQCDAMNDCAGGEDEQNCPTGCMSVNSFSCANGNCIPVSYKCDLDNDCGDGSDETNCSSACPATRFQCSNGHCVSANWVCDGDNDCGDMSDEQNCQDRTCSGSQFTCTNHKCIPAIYKCDSQNDCGDHSDEVGCTCDTLHFQCPIAGCIPIKYKCDGENDCGDMSDEENCPDIHPGACLDMLTYEDCLRMNTATYPICEFYADGHKYCRKYCNLCNT